MEEIRMKKKVFAVISIVVFIFVSCLLTVYAVDDEYGGSTDPDTKPQYYIAGEGTSEVSFEAKANGFTYTGHHFTKWADGDEPTTKYAVGQAIKFNPGVTDTNTTKIVYAEWDANTYTVEYYQGNNTTTGGTTKISSMANTTHTYGTESTLRKYAGTAPTGWTFAGWSKTQDGTSIELADEATVSKLVTSGTVKLYAVFQRTINVYSGLNHTTNKSKTQYYNPYKQSQVSAITLEVPANVTDWIKVGYRTDTTASATGVIAVTTSNGTATPAYSQSAPTYYAVYSRQYTANFYSGKAKGTTKTGTSSVAYYNTDAATLPTTVSIVTLKDENSNVTAITGWTKSGWRDDTTADQREYTYGQTATVAWGTNFYSIYTRDLTMAYNGNGATGGATNSHQSTQYYTSNGTTKAVTFKTATNGFTKTGYTFSKWANDSASGAQVAAGSNAASFNPGVDATGAALTKTMYAIWTVNKYTITFNPNGGTMNSSTSTTTYTQDYGSTITMNNPTRPGYEFLGWVSDQKANVTTAGYWTYTNSVDPLTGNTLEYINDADHTFNGYAGGTACSTTPTTIGGVYVPSGNSTGTGTTVNYTTSDPNPLNGISSTSFYRITRTSYKDASYSNGPSGLIVPFVNRDTRVVFVIVARFPEEWNINITGNGGPRTKWLTSQAGTGDWKTYVVSAATPVSNNIMDVGHMYLRNSDSSTNTTNPSMDVAYVQAYFTSRQSDTASVNKFKIGATNETLTASWRAVDQTVKITPNSTNGNYKVTATNLFDKTDMTYANEKIVQKAVQWNGASNQVTDSTHFISDWIRVVPGATYKITGVTEAGLVEWTNATNKNKSCYNAATQATSYSNNTNFTVPTTYTNTSGNSVNVTYTYMRFHAKTSDMNNIVLSMVDSNTYNNTQTLYFPNNATVSVVATPTTGYSVAVSKTSGLGTFTTATSGTTVTGTLANVAGDATTTNVAVTYTGISYKVVFHKNDGTTTTSEQTGFVYGTAKALTANSWTRTGYSFKGWSTTDTGTTVAYADKANMTTGTTTANGTVDLYAIWDANTYNITLNNANATTNGTATIYELYGKGIYRNSTKTEAMTASANPITIPQRKYTITYNTNGGSALNNGTSTYTFSGYYDGATQMINGTGYIVPANFANTKYSAAKTLETKWSGGAVTLPTTSTKTGYTFAGWYTDSALTKSAGTSYTPTANVTLYAKWTSNDVKITINKDGSAWSESGMTVTLYDGTTATNFTQTVSSGSTATFTTVPNKTYNVYIGKDSNQKTTVIDSGVDVTVNNNSPTATVNYYTLTMQTENATATVNEPYSNSKLLHINNANRKCNSNSKWNSSSK